MMCLSISFSHSLTLAAINEQDTQTKFSWACCSDEIHYFVDFCLSKKKTTMTICHANLPTSLVVQAEITLNLTGARWRWVVESWSTDIKSQDTKAQTRIMSFSLAIGHKIPSVKDDGRKKMRVREREREREREGGREGEKERQRKRKT